jgi:hypothetical protein
MRSIGYDDESLILEIEFRNGRVYAYYGVERNVFDWLMRTTDKGGYFSRIIRHQYEEQDVTPVVEQDLLEALRQSVRESSDE